MSELGQLSFWGVDEDGLSTAKGSRLVYFVECGDFVKIGFTTRDINDRLTELGCGNPENLKVIGTLTVGDDEDDRCLNKRFAMFHHRKEWFHKTPELLLAINKLTQSQSKRLQATLGHPLELPIPGNGDWILQWDCVHCKYSMFDVVRIKVETDWVGVIKASAKCHQCTERTHLKLAVGGAVT